MGPDCPACGEPIVYRGRGGGRPRKYCEVCVPSGAGGTAWHEGWLREHRDELEGERRKQHAKRMAEWRASMAQRKKQIAENCRSRESKRRRKVA